MYEIKELIKVLKSGNDGNEKKSRKLLLKDRSENKRWIELEI